jgi:porin
MSRAPAVAFVVLVAGIVARAQTTTTTTATATAPSDESPPQSILTWPHASDDLFGARSKLENAGVAFDVLLTADYSKNFQGGIDTAGDAFRHLLEATIQIDTAKLVHLPGGTLFIDFQQQNGTNGSLTLTGDLQRFDDIDADGRTQIAELWYQQLLFNDVLRLKIGKVDANTEFALMTNAKEFLNATTGFTPTILAMPTYPDPAMSVNVFVEPRHFYMKFGLYDGALQRGIQTGEHGPATFWGPPSDWFLIGEMGPTWSLRRDHLPGRLGVGGWYATGSFQDVAPGSTHVTEGTGGAYATLDQTLYRLHPDVASNPAGLSAYLQFGHSHPSVALLDTQVGGGLRWFGVVPHRPADVIGLGATYAHISQRAELLYDHELAIETFYKLQLTPWASVQPDVQYIQHPGGKFDDAIVGTLRVQVDF